MSRAAHLATINRQLHPQAMKQSVIDRAMAGMSYSQISADLGIPRGVVSGVVYRARRNGEVFPNQRSEGAPPPERPRERKAAAPSPRLVAPAPAPAAASDWFPKRLTLLQLRETSCRWPLWGNGAAFKDKFYCGLDALPGQAYCAHCQALSINPKHTRDIDRKLNIKRLARAA